MSKLKYINYHITHQRNSRRIAVSIKMPRSQGSAGSSCNIYMGSTAPGIWGAFISLGNPGVRSLLSSYTRHRAGPGITKTEVFYSSDSKILETVRNAWKSSFHFLWVITCPGIFHERATELGTLETALHSGIPIKSDGDNSIIA